MNIVIAFSEPFPYGGANTNRIISYAKEMVRQGHSVTVHCLQPYVTPSMLEDESIPKPTISGEFEGIKYIHTCGSIEWPEPSTHKLKKSLIRLKSYLKSFRLLFRNRKQLDILEIEDMPKSSMFFFFIVSKLCGVKYVVERSELPDIYKNPEKFKTCRKRIYVWISYLSFKLFDGWILETQILVDYYMPKAKKRAKCCIIPMTVEEERFLNVSLVDSKFKKYGKYIAYCGNMCEIDGLSILIKAFAIISGKYQDVKLLLAGNSSDVPSQKQLAKDLGIENRVVFLGKVLRDDVPVLLAGAYALALASPTSIRSCASMPCKVGEYLCTGRPVIVTGLGEIPKYVQDGVSAYLAKPDSAELFAEKLNEALKDSDTASSIGLNGKDVALREFSSPVQAGRIVSFFHSLL